MFYNLHADVERAATTPVATAEVKRAIKAQNAENSAKTLISRLEDIRIVLEIMIILNQLFKTVKRNVKEFLENVKYNYIYIRRFFRHFTNQELLDNLVTKKLQWDDNLPFHQRLYVNISMSVVPIYIDIELHKEMINGVQKTVGTLTPTVNGKVKKTRKMSDEDIEFFQF